MNYFLPAAKITRDQGKGFRTGGRVIVPQFHPAAALRAPEVMRQFRESFAELPQMIAGKLPIKDLDPAPAVEKKKSKPQTSLF